MVTVEDIPSVSRAWASALDLLKVDTFKSHRQFLKITINEIGIPPTAYEIQMYYERIDAAIRAYVEFIAKTDLTSFSVRQKNQQLRHRESELIDMIESVEHLAYKLNRTNPKAVVLEWVAQLRKALQCPR